jgi:hypothetical protein
MSSIRMRVFHGSGAFGLTAALVVVAACSSQSSSMSGTCSSDAGGPTAGPSKFGATMYGYEGDDDDCKYHVVWSATPICENGSGTTFTVKATKLVDGTPLTGAAPYIEAVQACSHPIPNVPKQAVEDPPGTYTIGPVVFDRPGNWVVRFHFYGNCLDALQTSPHGHAAFFVSVP